jgi:hypothetical protein
LALESAPTLLHSKRAAQSSAFSFVRVHETVQRFAGQSTRDPQPTMVFPARSRARDTVGALMSDIGIKGVGGLLVIAAAVGLSVLWILGALLAARVLRSRGRGLFGTNFIRWGAGPLLSLTISGGGLAWAFDGPGETVDRASPFVLLASLSAGVLTTVALRWWRLYPSS